MNSTDGRNVLGFTPTVGVKVPNPETYNLLVTWDLFKRDFRQINMNNCDLITQMPADQDWWLYYYEKISKMTAGEIESFYNT